MNKENYFLPPGYRCNEVREADKSELRPEYWNKKRISESRSYQYAVYSTALRLVPADRPATLIDVGCGPGTKLARISRLRPNVRILGFDRPSAINFCRSTYSFGEWNELDLSKPRVSVRGLADVVVCADVIEHLDCPLVLLDLLRDLCAPQGRIVISTPDRDALHGVGCMHSPNDEHVREWSLTEFRGLLLEHGFRVLQSELQLPMRLQPDYLAVDYLVGRLLRGRPLRTTQVHIVEPV